MRRRKHGGGRRRRALGLTVPHRSCVACRRSAPAVTLVRFARAADGAVRPDVDPVAGGRGAWTCASAPCVVRALERGGFERAFQAPVLGSPAALVQAVRSALEKAGTRSALLAELTASLAAQDFSPGRLAHPRGRA